MSASSQPTTGAQQHPAAQTEETVTGDGQECDLPWCGAGPLHASSTGRLMMPVDWLTAHPRNIRTDLDLDPEFCASIAESGVLIPLRITIEPGAGGEADRYRVIDGHRRLAAAVKAGLAEVPYDLAADRQGDEAGQYLDMFNAHRHRKGYTRLEEADALFAASEAGANRTRIRKATGLKAPDVKAALAAAALGSEARASAAEVSQLRGDDLTLEELAILAEFQDDPEALARLLNVAEYHDSVEHQAERLRQERRERAEHERLVAELEASGLTITDDLPPGALLLTLLKHDGERLTPETHTTCPGRGAYFQYWNRETPVHYCTDPRQYGHELPGYSTSGVTEEPAPGAPGASSPGPAAPPAEDPQAAAARRLIIAGNRAWRAATEVRHRWLSGNLFARRSAPREADVFVAEQLLTMPEVLRRFLASAGASQVFATITGQQAAQMAEACATAAARKLPLLALAPIATAYEHALTSAAGGVDTWRNERWSPCPYADAGRYFTFLASIGYDLSVIEQAVADGTPYTGDAPDEGTLTAGPVDAKDDSTAGDEQDAAGGAGEPGEVPGEPAPQTDVPDEATGGVAGDVPELAAA
jgi:ParB family transcriptional regulator, chromosome partitioning protein